MDGKRTYVSDFCLIIFFYIAIFSSQGFEYIKKLTFFQRVGLVGLLFAISFSFY